MTAKQDMRMERIERLLDELHYEVERGFMDEDIDETISYEFVVPISHQIKGGVVHCTFRTSPAHRESLLGIRMNLEPRLKLVPK